MNGNLHPDWTAAPEGRAAKPLNRVGWSGAPGGDPLRTTSRTPLLDVTQPADVARLADECERAGMASTACCTPSRSHPGRP